MVPHPQATADLVTIIKEILNGKLYFFVQCDTHTEKPYVRTTPYISVFSPNVGKYGRKKFRVRTLFRQ